MNKMISPATTADGPIVRLTGVQKSYDGRNLVVKGLSLDIRRGEFLTMLGPSGSGKTTTLMMIAGFEAPTRGAIHLNGSDITKLPPHKRGIGMVFQNYALFPHMTVVENVGYPLKLRGLSKAEIGRQSRSALEMVKLGSFGDRRPAQLSGGQQQRVALARALVFKPELVLLDEPLGALDKKLREQLQLELKTIHSQLGVTMIYVTHDQSEALTMSDRIAVFENGEIQQLASPIELYERPVNAFVADFVGENNRLTGRVETVAGDHLTARLADGGLVRASAMGPLAAGDDITLSVRPEKIALSPAPDFDNIFTVPVSGHVYLGDAIRMVTSLGGSDQFVIKAASDPGSIAGKAGSISIGWRTADCLAYRAASTTR
ncbi:putative spermidine/putrescine ABC transporter ATP-binding protein (plasmid) [Sinorhizobium fredii HH103]|uniref:Spermidine/putrescine import ATP-binding protein PotA n=1 Tax=Sinorhizobium fredii (strain HH103) TaxID=1117943 RepID=G9AJ87_SINF1|nr:ABC transporter ATP-binding protein [Sinorhizobium fredii]CCF01119.1 putative spermidine/putrescine ABC transporter ATP-binding protein [Sinorhizobium fredii HH103]